MKLNTELHTLTIEELVDYCEKFSTDPIVQRLVKGIDQYQYDFEEFNLKHKNGKLNYDNYWYSVPQIVNYLLNEVDRLEEANRDLESQVDYLKDSLKELSAKTVSSLISDLRVMINRAEADRDYALQQVDDAKKEAADAKSKLKMWSTLNSSPKDLK